MYYENGTLKEHTYWTNGKPEKCESWYDNGQKKIIKFHINGLLDGNAVQWYPNGKLQKKMCFSLGQMSGQVIEYYENGNVKSEGIYKNGQKDGIFIFYDEKGRTTKKTYIDGEIQTIK